MAVANFVLELPEGDARRGRLGLKLAEYKERLVAAKDLAYTAPELISDKVYRELLKNRYKEIILEELLKNNRVVFEEMEGKTRGRFERSFDGGVFLSAFAVIKDYLETGGKKVRGGTGLPLGTR